jgi:hypothetical protein
MTGASKKSIERGLVVDIDASLCNSKRKLTRNYFPIEALWEADFVKPVNCKSAVL